MNVQSPLHFSLAEAAGPVAIELLPDATRFSLRLDPAERDAAAEAFGLALPGRIGEVAGAGPRHALCLGPDEWMLWAEDGARAEIERAFAELYERVPHSLVDVSDREIAIALSGPEAATLLSVGCPLDLGRLGVGRGTRTVFDSVAVVLRHETEERWILEVWRSFAPHVAWLLGVGNRELAAGL